MSFTEVKTYRKKKEKKKKKNICCGCSLESPQQGDSNEHPQPMFLWRTDKNYHLFIIIYPLYLFHWCLVSLNVAAFAQLRS